jgi:serine protease Do
VEHDAWLPRGASGGPVVGADATVIAIDTHRRRDGFYVARVVTPELRHLLDELAEGRMPDRPSLGIAVTPPDVARRLRSAVGLDDRDGVLVREVDPDGAGARAGLRPGDLIVVVDDAPLTSTDDLQAVLAGGGVERLRLGVVRGAEELELVAEW